MSGYVVCNQGTAVFVLPSSQENIRSKLIQSLASMMLLKILSNFIIFERDIGA